MMPKPAAKKQSFATEVDLCARFIAAVPETWTAYAETAGWDVLLVRKEDGFQIGIEAKLRLNLEVINQAIEQRCSFYSEVEGPDCRAVLVPHDSQGGFGAIAKYIGVTVIRCYPESRHYSAFTPPLPGSKFADDDWHEWLPMRRHKLPEYVPDVPAGASAPVQLTPWKIAALKIAVIMEKRGYVTRSDFKHLKIDHRRWTAAESGWLRPDNGVYVRGNHWPDFKGQHPNVYAQIIADAPKWMPEVGESARQMPAML